MWECPITTYMSEIINQQMVERENAITLKISETIGVDVNREELIKALNYDRQQYEKGYADAKALYNQWTPITEPPEEGIEVWVAYREHNTRLNLDEEEIQYGTGICINTVENNWDLPWADESYDFTVLAWMPIMPFVPISTKVKQAAEVLSRQEVKQ